MAFALNAGVRLHWRIDGAADKPVLVLLNSIGTDIALYDAAVPHLLSDVRVLRIDSRGHGASDAPDGDYSLDLLAGDVLSVMDAAGVETAAVCGTSLGGMVAMTLALKAPARVTALVLACTSAAVDPAMWAARIAAVRADGTIAIADMAMGRFFSDTFRGKPVANGDRTAGGELFLVSTGVRVIGVALHENVEFGTLAQPLGLRGDHGTGAAAEFGAAGAEEYAIANAVSQLLLRLSETNDRRAPA